MKDILGRKSLYWFEKVEFLFVFLTRPRERLITSTYFVQTGFKEVENVAETTNRYRKRKFLRFLNKILQKINDFDILDPDWK